jgi:hypothetical protein
MTTCESDRRATPSLHTALDRGLLALGALVAVGVMVLFLALLGANRPNPAAPVTATPRPIDRPRLRIQPHGTAPPPTTIRIRTTPARRAEHPEPAVPSRRH